MSNMFSQFETDANLEQVGVWIDYGDFRVRVARAGGSNKKYLAMADAKTKPFRRAIQAGTMPEERSRKLLYEIFAHTVIMDWEINTGTDAETGEVKWRKGIHRKDGGVLEVTPENLVLTFTLLPDVFFDLQDGAQSLTLFRMEETEEDSKNSQTS